MKHFLWACALAGVMGSATTWTNTNVVDLAQEAEEAAERIDIAEHYFYGIGVEENKATALKYFESALQLAQCNGRLLAKINYFMGDIYSYGWNSSARTVIQSHEKARFYWEKAAEQSYDEKIRFEA